MIRYMIMLGLISLLALSGCFTRVDLYDYLRIGGPSIHVSSLNVQAGQSIEVKVEARFSVDERSRIREEHRFRTEIGICASQEEEFRVNMACPFSTYPEATLPESLILEGYNKPTMIRDIALQPGEKTTITYTVRLTSTEPGRFTLIGAYLVGSERGWSSPLIDSEEVVVTFR